ncbi:hypothetical protein RRSWK_05484 [Rhodopirellula sp. SWK7]|nr:hypothetical protein RRSWK_05484 [Rhodopirellula sp. SWK7]
MLSVGVGGRAVQSFCRHRRETMSRVLANVAADRELMSIAEMI